MNKISRLVFATFVAFIIAAPFMAAGAQAQVATPNDTSISRPADDDPTPTDTPTETPIDSGGGGGSNIPCQGGGC